MGRWLRPLSLPAELLSRPQRPWEKPTNGGAGGCTSGGRHIHFPATGRLQNHALDWLSCDPVFHPPTLSSLVSGAPQPGKR